MSVLDVLKWFAFGVRDYPFTLLVISVFCFVLERIFPWRKEQRALRKGFFQDLGWLVLNGDVFGALIWRGKSWLWTASGLAPMFGKVEGAMLLKSLPLLAQFFVFLVLRDFFEWCTHNLLHRVPFLWEFHKVHHSIEELDFIGNFRFHWMEIFVYSTCTYLPLALLGADGRIFLPLGILSTLIGHLNHSNLPISWGPLRYVINSPKMHVWHHDRVLRGDHGKNFAIIFSFWDWLFGTAYMPEGQPKQLGFDGMERFPTSLAGRLAYPVSALFHRAPAAQPSLTGNLDGR